MASATNALGGKLFDDDTIAAIRNRCIEGFPGMVDGRASIHLTYQYTYHTNLDWAILDSDAL